jgi:hypothetical protein
MSMLTPPGMGGKYRITGDKYPRMRRPRRRGRLVFDVFTGGGDRASAAGVKGDCTTKAGASPSAAAAPLPKPGQITVNVLNATPRGGLAKKTADELKKRGFKIGEVGNATATYDKKVKGTGVLLGPSSALKTSLPVLATQLASTETRTDTRKGTEVDLIIGTAFKNLTAKATADKALAALTQPHPATTTSKKSC